MVEFTIWDILRNLLLAARWTIVLSLIAFAGGALVGGASLKADDFIPIIKAAIA